LLENKSFIKKAPREIINKEKKRLDEYKMAYQRIEGILESLE